MVVGNVRWFNAKKGYGFLDCDEMNNIFVHYSAIRGRGQRALKEGEKVAFEIVLSDNGVEADRVMRHN